MRSHAKASSAGSSQGQGSRSGSFVRGAEAIRSLTGDVDGSGAPSRRGPRVILSLAATLLALALFASSAVASKEVISDFGTAAGSGSFGGELNNPRDVAVNESGVGPADAGDAYVADEANHRIERFDGAGNFISVWGKDTIASSVNERQRIVREATSGTYTLSFDGSTTTPLAYSLGAGNVRLALASLPTVGGFANVEVSGEGTAVNPFIVTFQGALGGSNQPTVAVNTSELTGTVEISTIANGKPTVPEDTGTGFEICTVAAECQSGTASGESGALDHPQSVAVDQDTGNVYASDRENRRIDEYDGEGNFIRSFGFDVAESGPGDIGTGYEVCSEADGDVCKAGVAGSGVGQYGEGSAGDGFGIAVSPADGNASSGTVYLADSGNRRVDTYDLDGSSPSSFGSTANFGTEQPRAVAVDSRGIVYASDSNENGDIQRYDSQDVNGGGVGFLAPIVPPNNERQEITFTGFQAGDHFSLTCPSGTSTEELTYTTGTGASGELIGTEIIENGLEEACGAGSVSLSGEPPNVTVTFIGALSGANQPQMTCTALSGSGSCAVTTISEGHPGPLLTGATVGLAVDPGGTTLYVLRSSGAIQQFGPVNEPGLTAPPTATDDTHATGSDLSSAQGFGFDSASGRLYVSATGDPDAFNGPLVAGHRVYVIADPSSLPDPTVLMESVTAVADRSATFRGSVDPQGGLVGCKFQYSTDELNWTDAPVSSCAGLSQNGGVQNVSQKVSGLVPGTHYFVRLQVLRPYFANLSPFTSQEQSTFTTLAGSPVLSEVTANAVDEHSVRVSATIDPSHSPTSYVVQYGTTPSLGSSNASLNIGSGSEPVEVSSVVVGLTPATQYYFKLVATNLAGSTSSQGLAVATFAARPSFGTCPNDLFRTGPSANLPDCRAYEQATPTDKAGSDAYGSPSTVRASSSGDGISFFTFAGFPGNESFNEFNTFLSHFGGGKWSTSGLNPPPRFGDRGTVRASTADLRLSFASDLSIAALSTDLVMRDNVDGSSTLLIPPGVGFSPQNNGFALAGAFDRDSKVVFAAKGNVPITSGPALKATASNVYLYDRDTGELTLAGLLPDSACGTPPCVAAGSEVPAIFGGYPEDGHVVSPSGDVYFRERGTKQLYLRRDAAGPTANTVSVSASERTDCADHNPCNGTPEPDPAGTFAPTFMGATPDGSHAFFESEEELTDRASTAPGSNDLYRFDAGAAAGQRLTDLIPGAEAVGMLGYSDSGSRVYLAANADLDGPGPATSGDCAGSVGSFTGSCSIYLWQADGTGECATASGCVSFVFRAKAGTGSSFADAEGDGYDWEGASNNNDSRKIKASRVSADGRILVFRSQRPITGEEQCLDKGDSCPGFYRYDAESGQISCLTCDPTSGSPTGIPALKNPDMFHAEGSHITFQLVQSFLSRNLSPDGNRFFFQTAAKLAPTDINGEEDCPGGPDPATGTAGGTLACTDVYEWEAPGTPGGSCTKGGSSYSAANGGCIYLLSTGTGVYPSYLADVSESGDTAFIFSRQQLLPSDEDTQEDIYAVKVDGGLAYQNAARPANCEGDACRGASSQPSNAPGAGSAVFEGPGNPKSSSNTTRCPKGKRTVHSKGKVRCVAKKPNHKKQKHRLERAANHNRRASR